jgi:hypothetical protein
MQASLKIVKVLGKLEIFLRGPGVIKALVIMLLQTLSGGAVKLFPVGQELVQANICQRVSN